MGTRCKNFEDGKVGRSDDKIKYLYLMLPQSLRTAKRFEPFLASVLSSPSYVMTKVSYLTS